ncbi:hypothetical protein PRIPAC_80165, partial [Pristionchus pacificus]|uniref:G protein-coupled receptor n=1 Tax=Pristionchus pacificus TaxID=54126 RepID=A0A2A6CJQ0_PRIPA
MLPIPSNVAIFFFVELIGCSLYSLFLLIISYSKQAFLNTPFFKLFISTGFAGNGVFYYQLADTAHDLLACAERECDANLCCTGNHFQWVRDVLLHPRQASDRTQPSDDIIWSPRTIFAMIFCQYIVPLIGHFYFAITPVNWVDGAYKGLDSATGSVGIYRSIIGVFYALYALIGVALNLFVVKRLRNLSLSSTTFYRQQRSLALYTIASTMTHVVFALHQFAWTYAFSAGDRGVQLSVRGMKPFVYGLTTFSDLVVLFLLSGQSSCTMWSFLLILHYVTMRALLDILEKISDVTFVTGFILNLLLLYLIRRFSTKELGTYKYLLEIFATYDTYLAVVHHITNPKSIPSSTGYSFVCDRAFGSFPLAAFYSSVYSVPFLLLNVHLLYRYWTIRAPHRIALFSNAKFEAALVAAGVFIHLAQFYASLIFSKPEDSDEIRLYQQLFRREYERDVNDGVFVMNYFPSFHMFSRGGQLSMRPFALLVIGDIMVLASLPLATALALMTYREILEARNLSETIRTFHLRILIAANPNSGNFCLPNSGHFCFVLNINISLFHIYSPKFSALGLVLLSCFPCLDAIVIIVLMKPYREGLIQLVRRKKKASITVLSPAFSTFIP